MTVQLKGRLLDNSTTRGVAHILVLCSYASTTPLGSSVRCVRLATTEMPRLGHLRIVSPVPAH